jgi:hypothetical protein
MRHPIAVRNATPEASLRAQVLVEDGQFGGRRKPAGTGTYQNTVKASDGCNRPCTNEGLGVELVDGSFDQLVGPDSIRKVLKKLTVRDEFVVELLAGYGFIPFTISDL